MTVHLDEAHGAAASIGEAFPYAMDDEAVDLGRLYNALVAAIDSQDVAALIVATEEARGYLRSAGLA